MSSKKKPKKNNKTNKTQQTIQRKPDNVSISEQEHQKNLSNLVTSLTKAIRTTNTIPSNDEYDFQISLLSHEDTKSHVLESKKMVLDMIHSITRTIESSSSVEEGNELGLVDVEDDDYILELSGGVMDDLLSNVEFYLNPSNGSRNDGIRSRIVSTKSNKLQVLIDNIIPMTKPQITYNIKVNNDRTTPFKPMVDGSKLLKLDGHGITDLKHDNYELPSIHYQHPYKTIIENINYPDFLFDPPEESTSYQEELSHKYINTVDQLSTLSQALQAEKEVAIDLEHHSYHSFQGITCLLQISLRNGKNYLIDTLALHHSMHEYLSPIFVNPNIVKIIHGCYNDILWLQRDFSLYLINLYDTCVASRILGHTSSNRLSSLISKYVSGIDTVDKSFQLSDWRQRPLSKEMMKYAVMDTRYLFRIYDAQRRDLMEKNDKSRIKQVLHGSNIYALKVYYKEPLFSPKGYERYIPSKRRNLTEKQETALELLWNWRDEEARKRDESLHYICPTNVLIQFGLDGFGYTWTEVMKECRGTIMSFFNDVDAKPSAQQPQAMQEVEEEWESHAIYIHPSNKDYIPTSSLLSQPTTTNKETPASIQQKIIKQLQTTMQSYIYPPWKQQEESNMKRKLFEEEQDTKDEANTMITSIQEQYDLPTRNKKQKIKSKRPSSESTQKEQTATVGLLPSTTTETNDNPFFTGAAITAHKSIIQEVRDDKKTPVKKKNDRLKYSRSNPNESGNQTFVYVKK